MHIVIAKVDEVLFDGDAVSITVPGAEGEMTVLGEHMPLITTLKGGVILVRESSAAEPRRVDITGGILEVRRDGVTVVL